LISAGYLTAQRQTTAHGTGITLHCTIQVQHTRHQQW